MSNDRNLESLKRGWSDLAKGNWDSLAAAYAEDMIFVLPGQKDVLEGRQGFRAALDNIGAALPPGFDITDLRYCLGENEITSIVEWKSEKIPEGTQSAVLFKFNSDGLVTEERWFVDTEQWKAAF
jgi:ketosteroid isomerase-like protein